MNAVNSGGKPDWCSIRPISDHWEREAKKQAAAAGEFRIALEMRLKQITDRAAGIAELTAGTKSDMDRIVLEWKLAQLREQEAWMRRVLNKNTPDWKVQMMRTFQGERSGR